LYTDLENLGVNELTSQTKIQVSDTALFICIHDASHKDFKTDTYTPSKTTVMKVTPESFRTILFKETESEVGCSFGNSMLNDTIVRVKACKTGAEIMLYKWNTLLASATPGKDGEFANDSAVVKNYKEKTANWSQVNTGIRPDGEIFVSIDKREVGYDILVGSRYVIYDGGRIITAPALGLAGLLVTAASAVAREAVHRGSLDRYFYLRYNNDKGLHSPSGKRVQRTVIDKYEMSHSQDSEKSYIRTKNFTYGFYIDNTAHVLNVVTFPRR
jgi:hypothetical protein